MQNDAFERGTDPELNAGTDPAVKGSVPLFKKRGATAALVICCVLTALWVAFIFSNSLKPGPDSSANSQWLLRLVQKVFRGITEHGLRKAAHLTEFAVLGVLGVLTFIVLVESRTGPVSRVYFRYAGWLAAAGVLIPVIDESIQYLVPGRAPEVADVLLDIAGFACGALLVTAIVALRARKARRPEPRP